MLTPLLVNFMASGPASLPALTNDIGIRDKEYTRTIISVAFGPVFFFFSNFEFSEVEGPAVVLTNLRNKLGIS